MSEISFHEATVLSFRADRQRFIMRLEGVFYRDAFHECTVEMTPVERIETDAGPAESLEMPTEDGEILTLDLSQDRVFAIIEWNDFAARTHQTRSYTITGGKAMVTML